MHRLRLNLLLALSAGLVSCGLLMGQRLRAQLTEVPLFPSLSTDEETSQKFTLPEFEKLKAQLEELLKLRPSDPEVPGRLLEAILAAHLIDRTEFAADKEKILLVNYPYTWQAAHLRKTGGWAKVTHAFESRLSDPASPIERSDMARLRQIMAMMIKENGIDWNNEKVLFYGSFLGMPAKDQAKLGEVLRSIKSPATRAARILLDLRLSVKEKIVDLADIRGEAALRGLERYFYAHELKDEDKNSKLVSMALARGYFEQRQPQEALDILLQLNSVGTDPEVDFYLAWAQISNGQLNGAKNTLEALDQEKSSPLVKECTKALLEAVEGHRRAGLYCRADLTRAISQFASDLPTKIGARIRIEDAEKGPRTLVFYCDTDQDSLSLAILANDKPTVLYKTSGAGTRALFDGGRDFRESTMPGLVPFFKLELRDETFYVGMQPREFGNRATETSLRQITGQSWFIPAFFGDFTVTMLNSWGWLNLTPECDEDGEVFAWVRPTFDKVELERLELRLNGNNRIKSMGLSGKFHVDFLFSENAIQVWKQIEELWPKVPDPNPINNAPVDHEKFTSILTEFYGFKSK